MDWKDECTKSRIIVSKKVPESDAWHSRMFSSLHHNFSEYESLQSYRTIEGGPRLTRASSIVQNVLDTFQKNICTKRTRYRWCHGSNVHQILQHEGQPLTLIHYPKSPVTNCDVN
ncbi:hypothetical protein TNCV_4347411 [Trichonephila clavipes]|nr:hypothetical protein TNCV_4347411 [Trichonephila clavipes]